MLYNDRFVAEDRDLFFVEASAEKSEGSMTTGTPGVHSARYSPEDDEDGPEIHVFGEDVEKDCDGHHFGPYMEYPSLRLEEGEAYCEVEGEVFRTDEGDEVVTVCPVCGEGLGDPGEVPGPNGETGHLGKEDEGVWVYYMGPKGGEGWMNMVTGEIRYQKQRPGPGPEDGDGYGDWLGDGWAEPPDDLDSLRFGQPVEIQTEDGEYVETEVAGFYEDGSPNFAHAFDGDIEVTAVAEDYDPHDAFFDDKDETPEEYWGDIYDEIPEDAAEDLQQLEVGEEYVFDVPGVGDVTLPIFGWTPEDSAVPGGEAALIHYDDMEAEVGTETMHSNWGEPGDASPTVSLPAGQVDDILVAHVDEYEPEDPNTLPDGWPELPTDEDALEGIEEGDPIAYRTDTGEIFETEVAVVDDDGTVMTAEDHFLWPENEDLSIRVPPEVEERLGEPDLPEIEEGPLAGYVDAVDDPEFDPDHFMSVDNVAIDDVADGAPVLIATDGNQIRAETHPNNVGFDPGDGDTIHPHEVDIVAVHESQHEAVAEPQPYTGPEEVGSPPDEDEAASAVATPASEETEGPAYTPDRVVETHALGAIGANHGNSMAAKEVHELDDGSRWVYSDLGHESITEEDGQRQMAGYAAMRHIDPERTIEHVADFEAGYFANEVAPGADAVDAEPGLVDEADFVDMAARQVIIGNADAHQNNVRVDEEGNLYPFDLDRSAGDVTGEWTGAFPQYENTLDRILGELEKTASALGVQMDREAVLDQAQLIAEEFADDVNVPQDIEEESGRTEFANTVWDNLQALRDGEVSLP